MRVFFLYLRMVNDPLADWDAGRLAWPGVDLAREDFERHLREARDAAPDGTSLAVTDLFLACACARGVRGAHRALEAAVVAQVPAFLGRIERDSAIVDEIVQRLRERVLVGTADRPPRIAEYRGRGSLAAWARVAVIRLHADYVAEQSRGRPLDEEDDAWRVHALAIGGDVAAAKAEHREAVEEALRDALRGLPPRDRTVLRMHYVDGLSLSRIGDLYRVDKATVSRWLRVVRDRVANDALARLAEETGMTADEARSLLGILASTLDLSLVGILNGDAASP